VLPEVLDEVLVLEVAERVLGLQARTVFRCAERQVDRTRCEEGRHAVVARLAVHVPTVVAVDVEGTNGSPMSVARRPRKASKSFFQAAACTLAVRVKTPSRSNRTAS
jgi:transglutaminase-like putative cysteine protease